MADAEKAALKANSGAPPESPTTARPLDFEDDDAQDALTSDGPSSTAPTSTEPAPPSKPPRPLSPREQAETTLREAFPSIDAGVVKAVLTASGGQVEPAFNALLGMTDPDSLKESEPPAKPPRPTAPSSTQRSQLEADEQYARQLAEHYSGAGRQTSQQQQRAPREQRPVYGDDDREHNFFDDDLPVIRENLRKGFIDTQQTVNKWVQNFKKRLDGDDMDEIKAEQARYAQQTREGQGSPMYGRSGDLARRSADRERYDADPQVLPDDFSTLELRDSEAPPARPPRPLAKPDLFKPTPPPPGRKVSFQDGPPDEIQSDMYGSSDLPKRTASAGKSSKWQPLSTVDPSPVADNDPFSLGDSDDDKEIKPKDQSSDEAERLQKATAEAISGDIGAKSDLIKS